MQNVQAAWRVGSGMHPLRPMVSQAAGFTPENARPARLGVEIVLYGLNRCLFSTGRSRRISPTFPFHRILHSWPFPACSNSFGACALVGSGLFLFHVPRPALAWRFARFTQPFQMRQLLGDLACAS
jgi:hypothetical protein